MLSFSTFSSAVRLLYGVAEKAVLLQLGGMLVLVAICGTLAACAPLVLKHLVDALAASTSQHGALGAAVLWPGGTYLLVLLANRIAADLRPRLSSNVEQCMQAGLRAHFLAHLLRLPMAYLVRRRSGELLHSVDMAGAGGQLMIAHVSGSLAPALIEFAAMVMILTQLHQPALVALFALTSATYVLIFGIGALRLREPAKAVSKASLDVHAHLGDGIAHVEMLRCFSAEQQVEGSLRSASHRLCSSWSKLTRLSSSTSLIASATFGLSLAACFAIAAKAVVEGEMTVGGFVLASVYMMQMVRPLEVLGSAARDLTRALGFMQPLLEMLAEPIEPPALSWPGSNSAAIPPVPASVIRLEDVSFAYDPARPVLCGLTLEILAGRTTAIVGPSGSGKSSLVRLLLRLYEPQSGRILIDGRPIQDMPIAALRAMFGLVSQDAALLHASAASNVSLGLAGATREEIKLASRNARVGHVIEALPEGYDTLLGERGQMLSGGERQRLAIARALLRQASVYLLDEPTSMLDGTTELEVMQSVRQMTAGRTTIIIAHRLSTVMHADAIVVLDDGCIAERGTHSELVAADGLYAKLWRQQTSGKI